jgi:hypothetical protein
MEVVVFRSDSDRFACVADAELDGSVQIDGIPSQAVALSPTESVVADERYLARSLWAPRKLEISFDRRLDTPEVF